MFSNFLGIKVYIKLYFYLLNTLSFLLVEKSRLLISLLPVCAKNLFLTYRVVILVRQNLNRMILSGYYPKFE